MSRTPPVRAGGAARRGHPPAGGPPGLPICPPPPFETATDRTRRSGVEAARVLESGSRLLLRPASTASPWEIPANSRLAARLLVYNARHRTLFRDRTSRPVDVMHRYRKPGLSRCAR